MSAQEYTNEECSNEYWRRIHKVQDYIDVNYGKPLTIDELSDVAGFSKYHFSRIFQSILHEPLAHYVNRIRLENSLFLLAHRKDMNITDIAYELGFTDSAIFSRAFKNYYGMSPKEYRNEYSKNCKEPIRISEYNGYKATEMYLDDTDIVEGNVTIEKLKNLQAVYVRHTGTYETLAKEYPTLIQNLIEQAQKQNLISEKSQFLAIYHDNPEFSEVQQFRTSLCITISDESTVKYNGILGKITLEGGLYAVGHFKIKQEQFPSIWNFMYQKWLGCSGYVPRNYYPFEVYRNDPNTSENHIHEVDIYVPIEPIF